MPAANEKAIADLKAALQGRLPDDQLNAVLEAAATKSAELDQHVSYKDHTPEETKEEKEPQLSADTKAILGALNSLSEEIKSLKASRQMPPDEMMDDDEEEEEGGKKKPKKKSRETAQTLAPEIQAMLRGLIDEKEANEGAAQIESRDLDPATAVLSKVFGGK